MTQKRDNAIESEERCAGNLLHKHDFYRFIGALVFAAVGVSVALFMAAQLFPVSAPLSGSNLEILPSMQGQAQAEPREKGLLVLAAMFGLIGAIVGACRSPFKQDPKRWHWILLGSLVPGLNLWIGLVMASQSATPQAVAALVHSVIVALIFSRLCADPGVSRNAS